jgi:hypothetical protein
MVKNVVVETSRANIRVSCKSRDVLKRYGKLKGWSIGETVDQIALTISEGLELLTQDVPVKTLRKFYPRAAILVVEDISQIFEPTKK